MEKQQKAKPAPKGEEAPFQHFEQMLQKIVSVPKAEIERREAEWRKQKHTRQHNTTS